MREETRLISPAKVNLTLKITGKRDDGYHTLDSRVVFTEYGDLIIAKKADTTVLSIQDVLGDALSQDTSNNSILHAHAIMESIHGALPCAYHLTKNLPVAAGIGGGSSNAATAIKALMALYDLPAPTTEQLLILGADVPVCFYGKPCQMTGIGDIITPKSIPPMHLVLVNPGVGVSTRDIFTSLKPPYDQSINNHLQIPAIGHCSVIQEVLDVLGQNTDTTHMSGSGATCFGIFETANHAHDAAIKIQQQYPAWWCVATQTQV